MVKKDKWITYQDAARAIERLIQKGVQEEKINGSMVWDELGYGSRHSAYKFLAEWRVQRRRTPKVLPFSMTEEMREQIVRIVGEMMGDALQAERQALAAVANTKDVKITIQSDEIESLMDSLAATEKERDETIARLDEVTAANTEMVTTLATKEAAIEALREEYDRLFNRLHASNDAAAMDGANEVR